MQTRSHVQSYAPDPVASTLSGLLFAVALLAALPGCPQPGERVGEQFRRATGASGSGSPTRSKGNSADSRPNADEQSTGKSESGQPAVEEPELQVRTVKVRTDAAKKSLRENFRGFLEREPLGFGTGLAGELREEAEGLGETARTLPGTLRGLSPLLVLRQSLPLLIVALFGGAFFVLNRHFGRIAHELQARIHFEFSRWATRLARSALLVAGRVATAAVLVALTYFPIRAVFGARPWVELLTMSAWYFLVYRAASSGFSALFGGRILEVDDDHARQLEELGVHSAQFLVGFLFAIAAVERLYDSEAFASLLTFGFRVTLVAFPIYLIVARDALLDLLPSEVDSAVYDFFRRTIVQNFRAIMGATACLLAFRAAGYVDASTFILARGYAIAGLVAGSFVLYSTMADFFGTRVSSTVADDADDVPLEGPDPNRLAERIEQLLAVALVFGVTALSLRILLLLEPALILLRIPFLAIGSAEISLLTLTNVGLVVFGTVLATKLFRALLNSQIYPLFEVDVGVAYAINSLIKYVFVVAAFFVGLGVMGVDLTAITVVVASLGVGIGFGLQTIVENLISGFILLFGQSVQKGDFITVDGTYGQVEAVGARSVIIKTPDNFEMLVPSKEIVGGRIINWSYDDNLVRGRLETGVSYAAEPEGVRDVLLETASEHERVLEEPGPSVRLTEFGDSSVNFELLFFFDCRETVEDKVVGELNFAIWEALEEADIEIPFPQRDLHIKSDEDWERVASLIGERGRPGGEATDETGGKATDEIGGEEARRGGNPPETSG